MEACSITSLGLRLTCTLRETNQGREKSETEEGAEGRGEGGPKEEDDEGLCMNEGIVVCVCHVLTYESVQYMMN